MDKSNLSGIGTKGNLMKEYSTSVCPRTVYLKDGSEFQIFLKNPRNENLGIELKFNGKPVYGMLVLKPGEKCWLERYIDDARKFVFETYGIDGNDPEMVRAAAENGDVEILFYRERTEKKPYSIWTNGLDPVYVNMPYSGSLVHEPMHVYCGSAASSLSADNMSLSFQSSSTITGQDMVETGRVEKGRKSDQKFGHYAGDFESFPFRTEKLKIIPESMKCVSGKELRRYCPNCGRKARPKDNYCPACGRKLD